MAPNFLNAAAILAHVESRQQSLHSTLKSLVLTESPTEDRAAVNAAATQVEEIARTLGGRVKRHKQKAFGDILELRFGPRRSTRKPILLLGHLDTVWPMGTLAAMPWREEKGRFWGPGVLDMKAGVVMALTAISTLKELKLERPIILLLNSEEEVGSPVSRPFTDKMAQESAAVFVLECAQGLVYKNAR